MDADYSGGYAVADGTSEAAPFVASTAALMLRERPGLSAGQVASVLCATATDVSASPASKGKDSYTGCGTINAHAAVIAARSAPIVPTFNPEGGATIEATAGEAVSLRLGVSGDPAPVVDIADDAPLPGAIGLFHDGGDWVLRGQAQQAGVFTVKVIADSRGEQAVLPVTITIHPGPATQVRAVPSTFFMKNTADLAVTVEGTDVFGNPAAALTPAELASATVSYSINPKCRFPTGKKPSFRRCTITVAYAGTLQPAPEVVQVYDTKQFKVSIKGKAAPGKRLTASIPAGWKGLKYRWLRNGRPIIGATARTYVIPKDTAGGTKFQVIVRIPGLAQKKTSAVKTGKVVPKLKLTKKGNNLTVKLTATGTKAPTGTILLRYDGERHKVKLKAANLGIVQFEMPPGRYKVSAEYRGNSRIAKKSTKAKTYKF
jgi:hypothetical protein